jgi:hypothetical protein
MTAARAAWIVPGLGVGIYQDAVDEKARQILAKYFLEGAVKTQMTRALPQNEHLFRGTDGTLHLKVFDETNTRRPLAISEIDLMHFAAENNSALFSYSYKPVGPSRPMQVPERIRVDAPLAYPSLYTKIFAAKTQASVNKIQPL